jgi:general secretion pathway protein H
MQMWRVGSSAPRSAWGFTLIEAIVALAVLALSAAVVAPRLQGSLTTQAAKADTLRLANFVAAARAHAMAARKETVVTFDTRANRYWSSHAPDAVALDADARMQITVASSERIDDARGSVRFFGDGTATGARVRITAAKMTAEIAVHWLTGRVGVDFGE